MDFENNIREEWEIDKEINEESMSRQIKEWWFDGDLFSKDANITENLKIYYAYVQVFHHNNFRRSNGDIEKKLRNLVEKIESDERYRSCEEKDKRLKELVLGTAYRRLAQFRTERYQTADTEHTKANYYLERDSSYLNYVSGNTQNDFESEDFIIRLLFLLNKAKYFRDIAEKDVLRVDSGYWRALTLFQEVVEKINEGRCENKSTEGVIARVYVSARLNIARVYRQQQNYEMVQEECMKLISFCIKSIQDEEEKKKIRSIVTRLPGFADADKECGFYVTEYMRDNKNMVDYLFEDYILQALLQLGISYRDRVDFNSSQNGRLLVKRAMEVFLILGIIDRIKDSKLDDGEEEAQKSQCIEDMEKCLDDLGKLELNFNQGPGVDEKCNIFVMKIKDLCTVNKSDENEKMNAEKSKLKNDDAKNNLAVCLKKLEYYTAAAEILEDESLIDNRFAEYNRCKCNLEVGSTERLEKIKKHCGKKPKEARELKEDKESEKGKETVYIYMDDIKESNPKWLFLYARYLYALARYEEAGELFHDISNERPIRWDSLELKSAYLEAQCLMKREKYLSAIRVLQHIHDSLLKSGTEKPSSRRHEIRTEIDLGYCYIMEDRYQAAWDVYKKLLAYLLDKDVNRKMKELLNKLKIVIQKPDDKTNLAQRKKWHDVDYEHQRKILHNLYDCWSYLWEKIMERRTSENSTEEPYTIQNEIDKGIGNLIIEICQLDSSEDKYLQFIDGLRKLNRFKSQSEPDKNEWKKLSEQFGKVLGTRPQDIVTYSCWVISKVNYCIRIPKRDPDFAMEKRRLLEGLVSSATPITMKSYIEVAKLIVGEDNKKDKEFLDIVNEPADKLQSGLERSFLELFCHIKLLENGTNQAFMHLMKSPNFQSIEIVTRARVAAMIVQMYGYVLQIKNQFRVTYDYLKSVREKYGYKTDEGETSPICQYTRLDTLKCLLLEKGKNDNGKKVTEESWFRMSNVAHMNDACEGTVFKGVFEAIAKDTAQEFGEYEKVIQRYINVDAGYQGETEYSAYDSDVYLACFSMNKKSFGLWSNYADDEKGCIIGFDDSFFDLVDGNDYSILDDEAEENALYRIIYVDDVKSLGKENEYGLANQGDKDKDLLNDCIPGILRGLIDLEKELADKGPEENKKEDDMEISREAAEEIRAFVADRLNEIRFLFKSVSYSYEEELRMLRCSHNPRVDGSFASPIPRLYIPVEKRLDNLTLILGSKVERQQFKELSAWAKDTGRVKRVIWSDLNRPELGKGLTCVPAGIKL